MNTTAIKFGLPLVNAHTHSAMVAFRGKAEDVALDTWLQDYIWPMEHTFVSSDFVYEQTKVAIKEMQKNGIRAVNDMYFYQESAARAAEELGMYYILGTPLLDFPVPGCESFETGLRITEDLILRYKDSRYIRVAVSPHSPYTVSDNHLIQAKELSRKYGCIYHIHVAETKKEFDDCVVKYGNTPIQHLDSLGILDDRTVMAHCVWVTDEDMDIIARTGARVVHCPLSNLKLGSGIAPVAKMLDRGIIVALGTDGAASSNRLDIWEAGKIAGLLQKGISHNPTVLPTKEIVRMMTVNGMKALGIDDIDGMTVQDIENEINKTDNFNYLYELNSEQIFS